MVSRDSSIRRTSSKPFATHNGMTNEMNNHTTSNTLLRSSQLIVLFLLFVIPLSSADIFGFDILNGGEDTAPFYVLTDDSMRAYDIVNRSELWRYDINTTAGTSRYLTALYGNSFYARTSLLFDPSGTSSVASGATSDSASWDAYYYAPSNFVKPSGEKVIRYFSGSSFADVSALPHADYDYTRYFHDVENDVVYLAYSTAGYAHIIKHDSLFNVLDTYTSPVGFTTIGVPFAGETRRATTDNAVDRYYYTNALSGTNAVNTGFTNQDFTSIVVLDDDLDNLYNISLPASHVGLELEVWNARGNDLVVVGYQNTDGGNVSGFVYIYDEDDGSLVGGFSDLDSSINGDMAYFDVHELSDGSIAIAKYEEVTDDEVLIYSLSGQSNTISLDADYPLSDSAIASSNPPNFIQAYDPDAHYRYDTTITPVSFNAIPQSVYRWYDDNTDTLSYETFNSILTDERLVDVTLSDVSLNNYEVPFIVNDGYKDSNVEFSALNYRPYFVGNWTVTDLSFGDNITDTYPFSSSALLHDFYEVRINYVFENLSTTPENSIAWIDFINENATSVIDYDNNTVFSIGVQYPYEGVSTGYDHNDSVRVYYRSAQSSALNTPQLLLTERSTGGSIENITLVMFVDRASSQARASFRLEVSRAGALDTVTLSDWVSNVQLFGQNGDLDSTSYRTDLTCVLSYTLASTVYAPLVVGYGEVCEPEGIFLATTTPNAMRLKLEGVDSRVSTDYDLYVYSQPIFGTGDPSTYVAGAEELIARIIDDGESTIRVYASNTLSFDNPNNYVEWYYTVTLDNATIVGVVDDNPFSSGTTTTGGDVGTSVPAGTTGTYPIPNLPGFSQAQSLFVYSVIVLVLIWVVIVGYAIFVANTTGDSWVQSLGVAVASIASILWVITAVFIGWLPVWVVVLMIILSGGLVTMMFRRVFVSGGE